MALTEASSAYTPCVAVIGTGPAGLACARNMLQKGYDVTVFEAFHTSGGGFMYGVPKLRLPSRALQNELHTLQTLGLKVDTAPAHGKPFYMEDLLAGGYDSVFVCSGAGRPRFGIEGEDLQGVYSAAEYMATIRLMQHQQDTAPAAPDGHRRVAVAGSSAKAVDIARYIAGQGGADVCLLAPCPKSALAPVAGKVRAAVVAGVQLMPSARPNRLIGNRDDVLRVAECIRTTGSGSALRQVPQSNFLLELDCMILADPALGRPLPPA